MSKHSIPAATWTPMPASRWRVVSSAVSQNSRHLIFDANGAVLYMYDDGPYMLYIYDAQGRKIYTYDKQLNTTYGQNGNVVMQGNILLTLAR